jgi:hypothetical protein
MQDIFHFPPKSGPEKQGALSDMYVMPLVCGICTRCNLLIALSV